MLHVFTTILSHFIWNLRRVLNQYLIYDFINETLCSFELECRMTLMPRVHSITLQFRLRFDNGGVLWSDA